MKKFNITFLMAGLMIISALSLSSCKKTNSSDVDEIPTTYINLTDEDVSFDSRNNEFIHCFYCPDPLYRQPDHGQRDREDRRSVARRVFCGHRSRVGLGAVCLPPARAL